jgi:DNA-binding response OmpR family regulator
MHHMAKAQTVLLVEGMKPVAERLAPVLDRAGYHVVMARTRKAALTKVVETRPVAIVLDTPSLRFDAPRFCSALAENQSGLPLLVLLAKGEKVKEGLTGDDYLWHPFSASALIKHIAALLSNVLQIGEVVFNVGRAAVVYGDRKRHLTPKQARLLETFMRHEGQVLTRAFLMKQVWDTDYLGDTRTLDVHVSWLRKAIEKNPSSPVYLRTIRGVGYCFEDPEQ